MVDKFDPDKYLAEESTFDPDAYLSGTPVASASIIEKRSELDPRELGKDVLGAAIGYSTGKAAQLGSNYATDKLDTFARAKAFAAMGGNTNPTGKDLLQSVSTREAGKNYGILDAIKNIDKNFDTAPSSLFDAGVNPQSVGKEILDNKLLGPFGFGSPDANLSRANSNLMERIKPTNDILKQLGDAPIDKAKILDRTKELIGYDNLNSSIDADKKVKKVLDKVSEAKLVEVNGKPVMVGDFVGTETPIQVEEGKRKLQERRLQEFF